MKAVKIGLLFVFLAMAGCLLVATIAPNDGTSQEARIFQLQEDAKRRIRASLRDPDSMLIRISHSTLSPVPVVCGEYNARNGFGGMAGFEPFVFIANSRQIITPSSRNQGNDSFMSAWINLCASGTRTTN